MNHRQDMDIAQSAFLRSGKPDASLWESVRCAGLTASSHEIELLAAQLPKKWDIYSYKHSREILWAVFIGGTGTGKSTIFNALCGESLSETGVERPKTFGPIAYLFREAGIEAGFPFPYMQIQRLTPEESARSPHTGAPGVMLALEHLREDFRHLVVVDTPDVDSLEWRNRLIVEDLYLLSDFVIFVTSQEKYADDVPFQLLSRIHKEGKPYVVLLNKAESELTLEEVLHSIRAQGIDIPRERFLMLPYLPSHSFEALSRSSDFAHFAGLLSSMLSRSNFSRIISNEKNRGREELKKETLHFVDLLQQEQIAAEKWLEHLDLFFKATCEKLFQQQEQHTSEETREYLQSEIRKLYSKYDLLGKPRRVVSQIVRSPLQALGVVEAKKQESHEEALRRIRNRIDLVPIEAALESFNRAVLEKLSPQDDNSPLKKKLREVSISLTKDEIRKRVWDEQDRLILWLEQTFEQLAQGIPKSKEWGIYSTSILWGGLILSLEAAVGGGIHILEAVLDSAIAPFVTKGAVELFAYHELQRIARELAERYKSGLAAVIQQQKERYVECLHSLTMGPESLAAFKAAVRSLDK